MHVTSIFCFFLPIIVDGLFYVAFPLPPILDSNSD